MSVFGTFGVSNPEQVIYFGLHALQHRGQEGAGMAVEECLIVIYILKFQSL